MLSQDDHSTRSPTVKTLAQPKFVKKVFELAKERGWHTALDTSGAYLGSEQKTLLEVTDLVLLDLKTLNESLHQTLIGWDLNRVLDFAVYLNEKRIKTWIRHVIVPGLTDDESDLLELGKFVQALDNVDRFELLRYHKMGETKWSQIGLEDPLKEVPSATELHIEKAWGILSKHIAVQLYQSAMIR